jgi:fatty-acyl-CoA synthase
MLPSTIERRRLLESRFPVWKPATIARHFDTAAARYPERPLIIVDQRSYSYRDVIDWSRRLAAGLISSGIGAGDHVAVLLANLPELVAVRLAVARIGAVAVPVNFLLRRMELAYVLEQSDSVALITMSAFRDIDYLDELDAIAPGWRLRAGGERLPALRQVFVHPTGGCDRRDMVTLESLESRASEADERKLAAREAEATPDHCSDIIYTSGTTGRSKGVMLTHDMVLRTAYASAYTRAFEDGRRIAFALPLYHVFGYVECLVACSFVGGAIIPQVSFSPEEMLSGAERHRATEIVCVPTMTLKLIEIARSRAFHGGLVCFFNSGGFCLPSIWDDIESLFHPREIVTAYGMTETTASTACTLPEDPRARLLSTNGRLKPAGAAGEPSLGGVLAVYKAADLLTGEDLPPGTAGELLVRGPIVTSGYYKKPEETRAAFRGEWLRTGDFGCVSSDGYVTLLGRVKEAYRCGGEMVVPLEIEELVGEHPLVAQVFAVGIPDPKMGEVGCLCVVPATAGTPDPQELIALCMSRLARFKVPRHVIFLEAQEVPTTPTGRPQKFKLAELAARRLAGGASRAEGG